MDSISQFIQDECELGKEHSYAASKFFQAYRDWCSGAGRKPQSQTAFKRSLEKLNGVYQHRSFNGLQWHGIQPCLKPTDVVDVGCVALSENFLLGFLWGLFGLGYISYIPYIIFFFYEKEE